MTAVINGIVVTGTPEEIAKLSAILNAGLTTASCTVGITPEWLRRTTAP